MSQYTLMLAGASLAALTMLLGVFLARRAARRRSTPLPHGLLHATLGVATVLATTAAAFAGATVKPLNASLLFLGFALIGGLFILVFRLQGETPPMFMVYLHAASAAIAFGLLGWALA